MWICLSNFTKVEFFSSWGASFLLGFGKILNCIRRCDSITILAVVENCGEIWLMQSQVMQLQWHQKLCRCGNGHNCSYEAVVLASSIAVTTKHWCWLSATISVVMQFNDSKNDDVVGCFLVFFLCGFVCQILRFNSFGYRAWVEKKEIWKFYGWILDAIHFA